MPLTPEELGWENYRLADPHLLRVATMAADEGVMALKSGKKKVPKRELVSYPFSPLVSDPLGILAGELGADAPPGPAFIPKSTMGKPLDLWKPGEEETVLNKSSLPYLGKLKETCLEFLQKDNLVLLLTLRSFSAKPWNFESERRYPRPDANIGTSLENKTPKGLETFVGKFLKAFGFWPELDWPHRGAYLPPELAGSPRLLALGLSFRRDLYMNETTGKPEKKAESLARVLRTVFSLLEQQLENVVRIRHLREHPPKPPSMVIKASE
jgi:hypothetical protein